MLSVLFGLISAIGWGAGDFTGGLAARRIGAPRAVFHSEWIGILMLLLIATLAGEPFPALRVLLVALCAGMIGSAGLLLLYSSMTRGMMSIATPVSALLAAALPVFVGMIRDGFPGWLTFFGFGFALFAVWMISQGEDGVTDLLAHISDLKLPLLAGLCFGLYFVVIHEATRDGATFWPMVFSRTGGLILVSVYLFLTRASLRVTPSAWPYILVNGVFDVAGNMFFILAAQAGRLDVASVLSSLYPGGTVLLALIFLKERLARAQWLGIAAALIAIVLMTV
ncbi:MAG: hypothetical protein HFACDABA_02783 [Anaerolineales bacterium]|nr:hypothetical protein [Anaerolineales bacterium]